MFETALTSRTDLLTELREHERDVALVRSRQIRVLREMSRRGIQPDATELAATLDVSARTARDLLEAAHRTPDLSPAMRSLTTGDWSFDRAAAVAALIGAGADDTTVNTADDHDIAGIHRLRAMQRRITRRDEHQAHQQRSLRAWASLDATTGFLHAQLTGPDWQAVTTALDHRADLLPRDDTVTAQQRRADALVALANDWLDERITTPTESRTAPIITITVDPDHAAITNGEAGAAITAGPRVGPETLDEITCTGSVEVVVDATTGTPLAVGPTTRVIPPKIRRYVLARDGGCVIDGCTSTYRLEVHHIIPRSQGGTHDIDNLITLCWHHHHISIHGQGMTIDPHSPPTRRTLIPASRDP